MQTRDNAENVGQKRSLGKRKVEKQSKVKTKEQMCEGTREQAGVVVMVHKIKVINRRQKGKQIQIGQAKMSVPLLAHYCTL